MLAFGLCALGFLGFVLLIPFRFSQIVTFATLMRSCLSALRHALLTPSQYQKRIRSHHVFLRTAEQLRLHGAMWTLSGPMFSSRYRNRRCTGLSLRLLSKWGLWIDNLRGQLMWPSLWGDRPPILSCSRASTRPRFSNRCRLPWYRSLRGLQSWITMNQIWGYANLSMQNIHWCDEFRRTVLISPLDVPKWSLSRWSWHWCLLWAVHAEAKNRKTSWWVQK